MFRVVRSQDFFAKMERFRWEAPGAALFGLLLFLVVVPSRAVCTEIAPFRLTGLRGVLGVDYTQLERSIDQSSKEGRETTQRVESAETFSVQSESYIFHPNLLQMELGGAVHFEQKDLEEEDYAHKTRESTYDFNGKWSFFTYKAYPFNLHYRLSHPRLEVGFADAQNVENESYGLDLMLRRPLLTTMPLRFVIEHGRSYGENPSRITDRTSDMVKISTNFPLGAGGHGAMKLVSRNQVSASGSKMLPIEEIWTQVDAFSLTSEHTFGERRNIDMRESFDIWEETGTDVAEQVRADFNHNFTWDYSPTLNLYNNYSYSGTYWPGGGENDRHALSIGATKRLNQQWRSGGDFRISNAMTPGVELLNTQFSGDLNYSNRGTGRWGTGVGYSVSYGVNSQIADRSSYEILDESHLLAGLADVPLNSEYVIPGSVTVRSQDRTQIYVENIDYRLTLVGNETRIVRLLAGNINDGDTVLVDYTYELDGSHRMREFTQSVGARFTLDGRYGFYGSYHTSKPKLLSGESEREEEISPSESYDLGTDATVKLSLGSEVTWKLEYSRLLSETNAHRRANATAGYATRLPFYAGFANLESGYAYQDNEESPIGVKQTLYRASMSLRPSWRSSATLDFSHRRDTGGEEITTYSEATLRYQWRRARFSIALTARAKREEQGETRRSENRLDAIMKRYLW